jgi:hypothetical protein
MPCLLIHLWAFSGDIDFVWYAEISILISKHAILSSIAAPRQRTPRQIAPAAHSQP